MSVPEPLLKAELFVNPAKTAIFLFLIAPASLTAMELALPPLELLDARLSNGLRVVMVPRHDAPSFCLNVTYGVGARDEKPGRASFAHFVEHMMFQGSRNVGKNEHELLIEGVGGAMYGYTAADRTGYSETLPKNQLGLALFLESDRMRSLAVTQSHLDNQRAVVREEYLRQINAPYGRAEIEMQELAYDDFADQHESIWSADLDMVKPEDVVQFHASYYTPNNAALTLVGDFDPAQALEQIKKYFDDIPAGAVAPHSQTRGRASRGERRKTIYDPLAADPRLLISYRIAPGNTPDNDAMEAVRLILSGDGSARFYKHIQDRQLVAGIGSGMDTRAGPGLLNVWATPGNGVSVEKVEEAINQEIATLQKEEVSAQELERIRRRYEMELIGHRETNRDVAEEIGVDAEVYGDPSLINSKLARFGAVTPEAIREAAKRYLFPGGRTVLVVLPGNEAERKP